MLTREQAEALIAAAEADAAAEERLAAEWEFWESVKESGDPSDFETYLEAYPGGVYEALARRRLTMLTTPVSAAQRVALVIGNGSYAHAPALANPLNDAADIGGALERLGFRVTRIVNADREELWDGLQKFSLAASASEMAAVFYAGHGIEVDRRNFLVPVDARLLRDRDVEFETVPLDLLMRAVERTRGLRLIILDACRDNPFAVAMQRSGATLRRDEQDETGVSRVWSPRVRRWWPMRPRMGRSRRTARGGIARTLQRFWLTLRSRDWRWG